MDNRSLCQLSNLDELQHACAHFTLMDDITSKPLCYNLYSNVVLFMHTHFVCVCTYLCTILNAVVND